MPPSLQTTITCRRSEDSKAHLQRACGETFVVAREDEGVASFVTQPAERLTDTRYVFVIVWCLLDASDELMHGEIRDHEDHVRARFRRSEDLPELISNIVGGRSSTH